MQLTTAIVVIVLCSVIFVMIDYKAMKESKVRSISSIAQVLGTNTIAPILFGDAEAAYENLTDLNVETNITNASVIDTTGKVFASYTREGAEPYAFQYQPERIASYKFSDDDLLIYSKIKNHGEWVGTICLKVDLSDIQGQLYKKIRLALGIVVIAALLAYFLAYFLQKYISKPITDLVTVMEQVMESGNYSLRSKFKGKDEVAKLSMAFNKMIGEIQHHDQVLSETNNQLERRVEERTLELREKNEKLVAAKALAEQSKTVKEQFLASMSHEIRTPLNAILGFQELLKETPLTAEQKEYVESVDFAGKNLLVIINDILDLSKIEAGKFVFEETEFNLDEIIKSVIELVEYRSYEKNLSLSLEIDAAIPKSLMGDSARLSQILLNLIGNAIKFTEKGQVMISADLLEETSTDVKCKFTVRDTGIGIPKDKIKMIFERFTQASSDTTRKYGGTGLGLTIVQQLVELQGGSIDVESEVGKGSSFSFHLRFKKTVGGQEKISQSDQRITANPNVRYRVLLAEDIPLNQRLVQKIMMKWQFSLDIANNGAEAIEKLKKNNYDLILMDIQMPEIDGYTATKIIRAMEDPVKKDIPIIAITAHASNSEAEKCINIGMNAYISKPFNAGNLKKIILQLMSKTKPESHKLVKESAENNGQFSLDYLTEHADGDNEFIIEMISLFLKDVPVALSRLWNAIEAADYTAIKTYAHSMKGLFLTLGISETGLVIKAIEKSAERKASIDEIILKYKEIEAMYEEVKDPLRIEIEKLNKKN
ncbi:MAG: rpfC 3 [Bacteroidota bacterium]|jgi:signal transduction histidine kinase/CheY-like chemotaxis protein/HPt (histidine-containing phosphotransfer) domain-containing protein|nr:rpfC 3 [Bacteroidota bacterium]